MQHVPRKPNGVPRDFEWLMRWAIPEPNSGCLLWLGPLNKSGYGSVNYNGKTMNAFVVAWILVKGPIPRPLEPDHLCRVRPCINPDHLELVTRSENCRRGNAGQNLVAAALAKTHCPQGHPLSGDNLYICPRGHRECKECRRQNVRDWRAKQ